jgi:DNA-binding XRE family transcriptional regulator
MLIQRKVRGEGGLTCEAHAIRPERGKAFVDSEKRERLEKAGWRVGTVQEFLGLSDAEVAFIDIKINLRALLKERLAEQGLTRLELAERLGSSQSRVAKIESGDPSVSLDLLVRALLATGATPSDIAAAVDRDERTHAA